MTIYKYQLTQNRETALELPIGATVLKVDFQDGNLCLWAMVNPELETEPRTFEFFGTGHTMPDYERRFINTFFVKGGMFVFHAFERIS